MQHSQPYIADAFTQHRFRALVRAIRLFIEDELVSTSYGGYGQYRNADTWIFSPLLFPLSYAAILSRRIKMLP